MLLEHVYQAEYSPQAKRAMQYWTAGDNRGLRYFLQCPEIVQELHRSIEKPQYKLYRGMKFLEHRDVQDLLGRSWHELAAGDSLDIKSRNYMSWTQDHDQAKKFAQANYCSKHKRFYHDQELDEYGIDEGVMIGLGMVVSRTFSCQELAVDLDALPDYMLKYGKHEHEVIVKPGDYAVKILDMQEYYR